MRIVFLGTPDFAAYTLSKLIESGHEVVAVITAPDRKAGRGQKLQESAVKKIALQHNLPCLQPSNLKDPDFIQHLKSYQAELQIVVAFRMLPEVVWNMPERGTMNLHASLLPYYRGAAPINWAIINGESYTGVSTFLLEHKIDTGHIILRKKIAIDKRETAGSLHDKLMKEGAKIVLESVALIIHGKAEPLAQDDLLAKENDLEKLPEAPKIFREDCKIDWQKKAKQIDQKIRGLSPYPAAWTKLRRKSDNKHFNLKIYDCLPTDRSSIEPGVITVSDNRLYVACGDNLIELLELQLEGKKRMVIKDFLNGIELADYEMVLA